MPHSLGQLLSHIGQNFLHARDETFAGHPLAVEIRKKWPDLVRALLDDTYSSLKVVASPGMGQWNNSPWLAILHPAVTTSAQEGYYPVFLFEQGFRTVCLVLGQGAQKLEAAVGKARAIVELTERARMLREAAGRWEAEGFSSGPFQTMREPGPAGAMGVASSVDPWAASVAFGKRYQLSSMPDDELLAKDLSKMLRLYCRLTNNKVLNKSALDETIAEMAASGEISDREETGIDGVKRVAYHKQVESRLRNRTLINRVKAKLGCKCQACGFEFSRLYGPVMAGFIEAHHTIPISKLGDSGATLSATEDHFMVLCSNCHRAIHAAGCPSLEEFRESFLRQTQF